MDIFDWMEVFLKRTAFKDSKLYFKTIDRQVLNIFHKVEDFLLGVITNIKIQIVTKKSGTIMDKNNLYIFLHN